MEKVQRGLASMTGVEFTLEQSGDQVDIQLGCGPAQQGLLTAAMHLGTLDSLDQLANFGSPLVVS